MPRTKPTPPPQFPELRILVADNGYLIELPPTGEHYSPAESHVFHTVEQLTHWLFMHLAVPRVRVQSTQ